MISAELYDNERLARGYAYDRPPVHPSIIAKMSGQLPQPIHRALDVGCGAGLSTAALAPLTDCAFGIEPFAAMLKYRRVVTEQAHFVVGKAEHLPFANGSFDLLTAAGALNYADLDVFFPEAVRVLTQRGVLAIYDFSEGRRLPDDHRLEQWYGEFKQRYPSAPGYALDVQQLNYELYGLQLNHYQELEIALPLDLDRYFRYVMSETCVEQAIASGVDESSIRAWCSETLAPIFNQQTQTVLFDAYFALVGRTLSS